VLKVPCRDIPRHTATYAQTTEQHDEQAASTLPAGLAAVCGFNTSMTLAYHKGAMNKIYPLSRRPDFVPLTTVAPLFWDGEVPSYADLHLDLDFFMQIFWKSQPMLEDAQSNSMIVNALRLRLEFDDLVREGYSQDLFYGDEDEWAKDSQIKAIASYFCRFDRLCIPWNFEPRLRLIYELHDNSSSGHIGVANTLAKRLERLWLKRIGQDVKEFCERCVVCRRAKIQP
jgi:hypothetical protein